MYQLLTQKQCLAGGITKEEAAIILGFKVFDNTLPSEWLDEVTRRGADYDLVRTGVVWCYDSPSYAEGKPQAVIQEAYDQLLVAHMIE